MAVRHGYGKVAGTDALVFAYDTGDTRNSYKGEPTENLITNPIPTSTTGFSRSGGTGAKTYDSEKQAVYWEQTAYATWGAYFNFFPAFTGTLDVNSQYTFSVEYYNQSDFAETGINYNLVQGNGQSGATYYNNITPKVVEIGGGWKRFTHTFIPANSGVSAAYNRFIVGNKGTDVLRMWFRNIQFEKKSHKTPFTAGTRSVSGSLLDLTGNSSVNLTNMSFDSNAQMTFDGTSDYINFPAGTMPNFGTDDFAIEVVFKMTKSSSYSHFYQVKDQYYFALKMSNGDQRIYVYRTSALSTYSSIAADTTLGAWHHLVCQRNGDNIEMYLNGDYKGSKSGWNTIDIDGDTYDTIIGKYNNEYSQGDQPVTKVYNRALTAGEVKNNYSHYKNRFGI